MKNKWSDMFSAWHFWISFGILFIYQVISDLARSERIEDVLVSFPAFHIGLAIGSFLIISIIYTTLFFVVKIFRKIKGDEK